MKAFFRILWDLFLSFLVFLIGIFVSVLISDSLYIDNRPLTPDEGKTLFGVCFLISLCIAVCFFFKRLSSPKLWNKKKSKLSSGMDAETHAQILLDSVQSHCNEINKSREVFDFWYSWEKLEEAISELIWLNEKKKVWMQPTPRNEWKKIQSNLGNTINDFLDRSTRYIPAYGERRASAIENLLVEIEDNKGFYSLFLPENKSRLEQLRAEAESIRQQAAEQELQNEKKQRKETNLRRLGLDHNIDVSDIDPFQVADSLETKLKLLHEWALITGASSEDSWKAFSNFKYACESSKLPLAAEIRLEDLLTEYEPKFKEAGTIHAIDNMKGHEFEHWCAGLLLKAGFQKAEVTQASGDDGVDIIAEKDSIRYAIQCKCYSSDLGNKPVQEVHTGKSVYHCHVGAVMTNRYFTSGGKRAAEATGTLLWDRTWIINTLKELDNK